MTKKASFGAVEYVALQINDAAYSESLPSEKNKQDQNTPLGSGPIVNDDGSHGCRRSDDDAFSDISDDLVEGERDDDAFSDISDCPVEETRRDDEAFSDISDTPVEEKRRDDDAFSDISDSPVEGCRRRDDDAFSDISDSPVEQKRRDDDAFSDISNDLVEEKRSKTLNRAGSGFSDVS